MIHHVDGETGRKLLPDKLTEEQIIAAAVDVERALGPALVESAHEECRYRELDLCGLQFVRQVPRPVESKG